MDATGTSFTNFRDMGGLVCGDAVLRKGKLFRSPLLVAKKKRDRRFLDSLNLDAIIDLRTPDEVAEKPDYLPRGCEFVSAPVYQLNQFRYITATKSTLGEVLRLKGHQADVMRENKLLAYAQMPFSPAFSEIFKRMDAGKTIAFHCSEGKDRTGIASMLIEFALGRAEMDIRTEYLRSNKYFEQRNRKHQRLFRMLRLNGGLYRNLVYCENTHDELFDAALASMRDKYVDITVFLKNVHGITMDRAQTWKQHYLSV
jgi:protein-tyrosine phosphatase